MMTYIDLLNKFWRSAREFHTTCEDAAVYMYLLDRCNSAKWKCPFDLPTESVEKDLRLPRKEFAKCRNRLRQLGYIDFQGQKPTLYTINGVDGQPENGNKSETNLEQIRNKSLYNIEDIKILRYLTPQITRAREGPDDEKESFSDPPSVGSPTEDEVLECFRTYRANERLQDWEYEASRCHSYYASVGWKTPGGAKIVEWKLAVKGWVDRTEKEQRTDRNNKQRQNGNNNSDKLSGRKGTDATPFGQSGYPESF